MLSRKEKNENVHLNAPLHRVGGQRGFSSGELAFWSKSGSLNEVTSVISGYGAIFLRFSGLDLRVCYSLQTRICGEAKCGILQPILDREHTDHFQNRLFSTNRLRAAWLDPEQLPYGSRRDMVKSTVTLVKLTKRDVV